MNDALIARLRAGLDEDERVALAALEIDARAFPSPEFTVEYMWARQSRHASGGAGTSFALGAPDPARVLRWVKAAREILERHFPDQHVPECDWCEREWPCTDVRALASVYGNEEVH